MDRAEGDYKTGATVREVILAAWERGEDPRLLFPDIQIGQGRSDERSLGSAQD